MHAQLYIWCVCLALVAVDQPVRQVAAPLRCSLQHRLAAWPVGESSLGCMPMRAVALFVAVVVAVARCTNSSSLFT